MSSAAEVTDLAVQEVQEVCSFLITPPPTDYTSVAYYFLIEERFLIDRVLMGSFNTFAMVELYLVILGCLGLFWGKLGSTWWQ